MFNKKILLSLLFSLILLANCGKEGTNPIESDTPEDTTACLDSSFMGFECGAMPQDWSIIDGSDEAGTGDTWEVYNGYPKTGEYVVMASQNGAMLITPTRTISDGDMLEFYIRGHRSYSLGSYRVLISTSGRTSVSDFSVIKDTTVTDNEYEKISIDLSDYKGKDVYIGWQIVSFNISKIYLDNITIISNSQTSTDFNIDNFSYTINTSDTSLTLDWDAPSGGALAYTVYFSSGASKVSILGDTSEITFYNNYSKTNKSSRTLSVDSTYSFYVRSLNSNSVYRYSDTLTVNFTLGAPDTNTPPDTTDADTTDADTTLTYPSSSTFSIYVARSSDYTIVVNIPANQLVKVTGKDDYMGLYLVSSSGDTLRDDLSSWELGLFEIADSGKYTFVFHNKDRYESTQLRFRVEKLGDITGNEGRFIPDTLSDSTGEVIDTIPGSGDYNCPFSTYYLIKGLSSGDSITITKEALTSAYSTIAFDLYDFANDKVPKESAMLNTSGTTYKLDFTGDLLIRMEGKYSSRIINFTYLLSKK